MEVRHREDRPDPEFFRQVLYQMPSPLLVISPEGRIEFANEALLELTGHQFDPSADADVFDHVHPDDSEWVSEAFLDVAQAASNRDALPNPPAWAAIHFRLVHASGHAIPIEVTGLNRSLDADIRGLIYDVRPVRSEDLTRQVLKGLAKRAPVEKLLELVIQTIALPPLDLDAAVLEPDEYGGFRPIISTSPALTEALNAGTGLTPWNSPMTSPASVDLRTIGEGATVPFREAGYVHLWHLAVQSSVTPHSYRLVCCTSNDRIPASGTTSRLNRANELAELILIRTFTDELLEHADSHDPLTGLPNRSGFYSAMATSLGDSPIAVMYLDLDGLKPVNDRYGHRAGDAVLQRVAERLRRATRDHDVVARLGGDEFAVVLRKSASGRMDVELADHISNRLLQVLAEPIIIEDVSVTVSASVGIVLATEPSDIEELLSAADAAMYEAKRAGGNQKRLLLDDAA